MSEQPPAPPPGSSNSLDRAVDALASGNQTWQNAQEIFPGLIKVFLISGLGLLSWVSTYTGMLELITANTGGIDLVYRIAVGFAVAMLMLMIIYILDVLFSPVSWWLRILYTFGYIFLTLISVGFGFGFYWKFLESRAEATRSAESAITQVQTALQQGETRLNQLEETLTTLTTVSRQKAVSEREEGNTCPDSVPGDGPRRKLRDADAREFAFDSTFIAGRAEKVKTEFNALNADMNKVLGTGENIEGPGGTRNAFMHELNRKLDLTITRFNTLRTDPQLAEIRDSLDQRAGKTEFPTASGGTFQCPDPQLQRALRGSVRAIDSLPEIEKPDVAAVEGSEAVVEAFRRLTTTMIGLIHFDLPPSPDELRDLQQRAVQQAGENAPRPPELQQEAGLGDRDYIPLFVALFVDFCILLVSINRPINRFQLLMQIVKDSRKGGISEILNTFHDTHQEGLAEEFEIFHHVVFDFMGDYYVAVPIGVKRSDARYLANLLVSLEGKGIVDRAMMPPTFVVKRKLADQGSEFADEKVFRLYRFRDGAYSKLVLDSVLGKAGEGAGPGEGGGAHRQSARHGGPDYPEEPPMQAPRGGVQPGPGSNIRTLPRPAPDDSDHG